jgi:hypothetical protein
MTAVEGEVCVPDNLAEIELVVVGQQDGSTGSRLRRTR